MKTRQYPPKVVKKIWKYVKQYGYVCYYTGMALDMEDPHSPWFCVFDHWAPHDPSKIVVTFALLSVMKFDLTEAEFWYYIEALADYNKKGKKIRKRRPVCWSRRYPLEEELKGYIA